MLTSSDRPRFEVVVGTTSPAERRLITPEIFRARTGIGEEDVSDSTLELMIDGVLAQIASHCKLVRAGTAPATFAQESFRATWPAVTCQRDTELRLPWRVPISYIGVEEAGVELGDSDFEHLGAGVLRRLSSGSPARWSSSGIIVDWTAGWVATPADPSAEAEGDPMPDDVLARIVDQVKVEVFQADEDLRLRSENVPNVWSGSYGMPGGDASAIGKSGLLRSLESVLVPFKLPLAV